MLDVVHSTNYSPQWKHNMFFKDASMHRWCKPWIFSASHLPKHVPLMPRIQWATLAMATSAVEQVQHEEILVRVKPKRLEAQRLVPSGQWLIFFEDELLCNLKLTQCRGNTETFKRRRETEIKHGRVAMYATMGLLTWNMHHWKDLFIFWKSEFDQDCWVLVLLLLKSWMWRSFKNSYALMHSVLTCSTLLDYHHDLIWH